MDIELTLTDEERRDIVTDLNGMLRASGRQYSWYPALGRTAATAWNKLWHALTNEDHPDYVTACVYWDRPSAK